MFANDRKRPHSLATLMFLKYDESFALLPDVHGQTFFQMI